MTHEEDLSDLRALVGQLGSSINSVMLHIHALHRRQDGQEDVIRDMHEIMHHDRQDRNPGGQQSVRMSDVTLAEMIGFARDWFTALTTIREWATWIFGGTMLWKAFQHPDLLHSLLTYMHVL